MLKLRTIIPTGDTLINDVFIQTHENTGLENTLNNAVDTIIKSQINSAIDVEGKRYGYVCNSINYSFISHSITEGDSNKFKYIDSNLTDSIIYNSKSFTNSYFFLRFYDLPLKNKQKRYITLSIPASKGNRVTISDPSLGNIDIPTTDFSFDYFTNKENYYIHWLADNNVINLPIMYMSAIFYSSVNGKIYQLTNKKIDKTNDIDEVKRPVLYCTYGQRIIEVQRNDYQWECFGL